MDVIATTPSAAPDRFRRLALGVLLAGFALCTAHLLSQLRSVPGVDFAALWAGGRAALSDPQRIYDFRFVTDLQEWKGWSDDLRPFVYPPSALIVLAPFSQLPRETALVAWVLATGALFLWAGRRLGAPWWLAMFPATWFAGYCGQSTFLVGGLTAAALTFPRRPLLAGVLLGVAAAVKPQMLLFAPLALLAEGRLRTLAAAGATCLFLCAASAALWGPDVWTAWLTAMPRFQALVFSNPKLADDAITPYAALAGLGLPGALAWLLAPFAAWLVWRTFRGPSEPADRLIALIGAALLVSPYALHYDSALLAPAVAVYLARTEERPWLTYAAAATVFAVGLTWGGITTLAAALSLPFMAWLAQRSEDPVRTWSTMRSGAPDR